MLHFERLKLSNGLRILVNTDVSTPLVAMNILYQVGAKNEEQDKTGFAHLFEHLMFGGSANIPVYDEPLQLAGGENNAFTNNDFTNYYLTIPFQNVETAFWLESDRMLSLAFSEKSLEVQRQVVVEEFRQRYLNQPYGDAWLLLRPLAYKVHPYQWPTIGKEISHIEQASMDDVRGFFSKWYHTSNAILTLSGNITLEKARELSEKWFGPIEPKAAIKSNIPAEPAQTEKRILEVERPVPHNALYKAWHCGKRTDSDFHTVDLLTDILSGGKSSRLYNRLVKERKIFSGLNLYLLGELDPSLVVADGKIYDGVSHTQAEQALNEELFNLIATGVGERELKKVVQKAESAFIFGEMNIGNRALNMAYFEMLGNAAEMNLETSKYRSVTGDMIISKAAEIFREENSSVIYYKATSNQ